MWDATAKPWGKRIGIAIGVLVAIVLCMGGLYKLRRSSNLPEKRKRVVVKDRESWLAKDKIALTKVGSSPSPECEEALGNTEEVVRFLQQACNQGEGAEAACEQLYHVLPGDSADQKQVFEYWRKATIQVYELKCDKGSGDAKECDNLYTALPDNSAEKRQAHEYLLKALNNKCAQGSGDDEACLKLYYALPQDSAEKKQAEEYSQKAIFKTYAPKCVQGSKDSELCLKHYWDIHSAKESQAQEYNLKEMTNKCAQGSGDPEACLQLHDALPRDSAKQKQAEEYWQQAIAHKCNKDSGDPKSCSQVYHVFVDNFADKKQAKKYWLEAWIRSCENKNQVEYCKALLEISEPEQVPKIKRAADQLLKLCLIEHQYEACSPVVQHYYNTLSKCFETQEVTQEHS